MNVLGGIGRFVYDFIIGDDWKIAAAVVLALAATAGVLLSGVVSAGVAAVIGAVLVLASFSVSLLLDVRAAQRKN